MKKQIITLAVAALLLSSCGIYTKYERPEVKTDGLYGQDIEVEDTTSIAVGGQCILQSVHGVLGHHLYRLSLLARVVYRPATTISH